MKRQGKRGEGRRGMYDGMMGWCRCQFWGKLWGEEGGKKGGMVCLVMVR